MREPAGDRLRQSGWHGLPLQRRDSKRNCLPGQIATKADSCSRTPPYSVLKAGNGTGGQIAPRNPTTEPLRTSVSYRFATQAFHSVWPCPLATTSTAWEKPAMTRGVNHKGVSPS